MLRRLYSFVFELVQVVVFAVSIFLFLYLLILQPHKIDGASMEPNFHHGEYLLTDKISYRFNEPKRGEVIVFKAPPDYSDEYIKRIIGLPGEKIELKDNHIYINDNALNEYYIPQNTQTQPKKFISEGRVYTIPDNAYVVFGDNRSHSLDSRDLGFIERKYITGRAWFVYWPPDQLGLINN